MKGFFLVSFGAQRLCTNVNSTLLYDMVSVLCPCTLSCLPVTMKVKKILLCFVIGLLFPNLNLILES